MIPLGLRSPYLAMTIRIVLSFSIWLGIQTLLKAVVCWKILGGETKDTFQVFRILNSDDWLPGKSWRCEQFCTVLVPHRRLTRMRKKVLTHFMEVAKMSKRQTTATQSENRGCELTGGAWQQRLSWAANQTVCCLHLTVFLSIYVVYFFWFIVVFIPAW